MKYFSFLFLIFLFTSTSYSASNNGKLLQVKSVESLKSLIRGYSKSKLEKKLRNFVRLTGPNRMIGESGHRNTIPILMEQVKSISGGDRVKVYVQQFSPDLEYGKSFYRKDFHDNIVTKYSPRDPIYKQWNLLTSSIVRQLDELKGVAGRNLIWEKKGSLKPEEVLILGAHYDTIALDKSMTRILPKEEMQGADDNGTGVTILLGLIELLSKIDNHRTVRIIFFDFQELGMLGSRGYIQKYNQQLKEKEKVVGFVSIEQLGHDTKIFDKQKKHGNMKAYIRRSDEPGSNSDRVLAQKLISIGKKVRPQVKFAIDANSFPSSDHANFWKEGFPAVMFTQNWEDDYNGAGNHGGNDFVETLNMTTYYNVFLQLSSAVIGWSVGL